MVPVEDSRLGGGQKRAHKAAPLRDSIIRKGAAIISYGLVRHAGYEDGYIRQMGHDRNNLLLIYDCKRTIDKGVFWDGYAGGNTDIEQTLTVLECSGFN